MQERIVNPVSGIYPATGDYVHAVELTGAQRILYLSGTMGLKADGTAPGTLEEQLTCVWSNIRHILSEAQMTTDNIVRVTSYMRDPAYAVQNQQARLAALGERRVPTTAIVAQTLSEDWKIEIEVIAAA
ncbi:RidA family protein [Labrenzia sp. OB1]|uniref:RidA family protein n=1 Tax=Labrenzia sp. OB1 TaxID=1561204 RepID=UPI0007B18206|nr:RidA family protein [Labrenzia sp. OB1]KZM49028.1 endoribonuclease L-PSP [Labrenzia sp. OB1]